MAGSYGFGNVTEQGFTGFESELSQGAWGAISVKKADAEDQMTRAELAEIPLSVSWKIRLTWALRTLAKALEVDPLGSLDTEWDSAQRALAHHLNAAAEDKALAVREAAFRLKTSFLKDGGTGQTILPYDQEVDFGKSQIVLAARSPHAEDIKTVGAAGHVHRIKEATEALAKGLGREPGQNRAPARGRRVRDALSVCVGAFNAVLDSVDWAIDHSTDEHRKALQALRAPLQALLERYPASAPAPESAPPVPTQPA